MVRFDMAFTLHD